MGRSSDIARASREDSRAWGIPDRDGRVRSSWGVRNRAAFRAWLPDAPTGACSRARAAIYVRDIEHCLEQHREELTRSEQSYLYRLAKTWRGRADGLDGRFDALGGVFGGRADRHRAYTPADCLADLRKLVDTHSRRFEVRELTDEDRYATRNTEESMTDRLRGTLDGVGEIG